MSNSTLNQSTAEEICCPRFDPEPWHDQQFVWQDKLFVRDTVWTFFYIPLNFGQVMRRLDERVRAAGSSIADNLVLSDHVSKWKMEVLAAAEKPVAGTYTANISGTFYSRVYEGDFKHIGEWRADFAKYVEAIGKSLKKQYFWYTTCPKCAKKYGKSYVVIIGQLG